MQLIDPLSKYPSLHRHKLLKFLFEEEGQLEQLVSLVQTLQLLLHAKFLDKKIKHFFYGN